MYTQVYFHDVRRVYDLHLKEFLEAWLPGGKFPSDWNALLAISDHEILTGMRSAAAVRGNANHELARRVLARRHFRTVYELVSVHKRKRPTILRDLLNAATSEFGVENIRSDAYGPKSETNNFLVQTDDRGVESSLLVSGVIANVPAVEIGLIFASAGIAADAKRWIDRKLRELLN